MTTSRFLHPEQRLWHRGRQKRVRQLPLGRYIGRTLIALDTALLVSGVVGRGGVSRRRSAADRRVVYVDCGTHRSGTQVRLVHSWLHDRCALEISAFEADPQSCEAARLELADLADVEVSNVALVGPDHTDATVRLYGAGGSGVADSLYQGASDQPFSDVPARRLSELLGDVGDAVILLRMNIEGAEFDVMQDLVAARVPIAGYYGMWDDVERVVPDRIDAFRAMLRREGIVHITFNERDSRSRLRLWAIRHDMLRKISAA